MANTIRPNSEDNAPILSPDGLASSVVAAMKREVIAGATFEENIRHMLPKTILVNYLFKGVALHYERGKSDAKHKMMPLKDDPNLLLYMFFLSQNRQFNFNFNYLLKKRDKTEIFREEFRKFIDFLCEDLSKIISQLPPAALTFVVDEFLQIDYDARGKKCGGSLIIDNFNRLFSVTGYAYSLKVLKDAKVIGEVYREKGKDSDCANAAATLSTLLKIFKP